MRVGFDAHMVGQRETGNETYALGLLYGFNQIGVAVDAYAQGDLPSSIHRIHRLPVGNPALRVTVVSPLLAARDGLDLFHATYVLPPVLPCPAIVTVHDITYALYPEWFTDRVRLMLDALVPYSMGRATTVITISEHTKRDIVERYGVRAEKIAVTLLAPRPTFAVREEHPAAAEPFFLFVGNVQPRKNVETVIEAIRLLRDRGTEIPLIVAGNPGLRHAEVVRQVGRLRVGDLVRFTGYLPDHELRRLYATCTALVHPALYEGFGLTPLEAMVQGAAVLVANTSSVPEVVGDSALLLDPYDVESWVEAMQRVLSDAPFRQSLCQRGLARVQDFSWERCARETLALYRSAVEA